MSSDIKFKNAVIVERKINEGCAGYTVGTASFKFKASSILDELIKDGVVASYDWLSLININIYLVGDIKEINITGIFH